MGIFRNRSEATAPRRPQPGVLAEGIQLRSAQNANTGFDILEQAINRQRPRHYADLPHLVACGHRWLAASPPPTNVMCFSDPSDDFVAVAAWQGDSDTDFGLFMVGAAGARRDLPIMAQWRAGDPTLAPVGTIPAKSIALTVPPVRPDFAEEIVRTAGFPVTPANVAAMRDIVIELLVIKAQEYISSQSRQLATDFAVRHRQSTDPQTILRDLGDWNGDVLPYIQDLPVRIRAIILRPEGHDNVAARMPRP
ncbi:hypothetical protein ACFPIJ_57885 [Dactylosporangium cerinum]|uniref:Uncharacterized protein n=1 Tax=Dactylosporangium cerinum TaxID=1434730 RepID=A0ABV9WFF9_9ACTN